MSVLLLYSQSEWRRRESNEQKPLPNLLTSQQLATFKLRLSAHCQHFQDTDWLNLSSIDSRLANLILRWPELSDATISNLERHSLHDYANPACYPIIASKLRELQFNLDQLMGQSSLLEPLFITELDEALRQLQLVLRRASS